VQGGGRDSRTVKVEELVDTRYMQQALKELG
jgi:hypothetical protein